MVISLMEQILMKTNLPIGYVPKLQVWHIPQVPMKAFKVDVANVTEALKIMETLALYDDFEYSNNVKGDYCNMQGLAILYPELTGDDAEMSWDIEFEYKGNSEYFDTPAEFMHWLNQKGMTEEQFLNEVPTAYNCCLQWIKSSLEEE